MYTQMFHSLCPHPSHFSCLHLAPCPTVTRQPLRPVLIAPVGCTLSLCAVLPCVLIAVIKCMARAFSGREGFLVYSLRQATACHGGRGWQRDRSFWLHHAYSQQRETDKKWTRKLQGLSQRPTSSSETLPSKGSITSPSSAISWGARSKVQENL